MDETERAGTQPAGTELQNEKEGGGQQPDSREENLPLSSVEAVGKEYPEYVRNGELLLPQEVQELQKDGIGILEACRMEDLRKTKELAQTLQAELAAERANRENARLSTGSVAGGEACEKDYYSSHEWDKLPAGQKEKLIRNGKIFEFMKKWRERT